MRTHSPFLVTIKILKSQLVNAILAKLVMEYIGENAISTAPHPPRGWIRYVDDSHVVLHRSCRWVRHHGQAIECHHLEKFNFDLFCLVEPSIRYIYDTGNDGLTSWVWVESKKYSGTELREHTQSYTTEVIYMKATFYISESRISYWNCYILWMIPRFFRNSTGSSLTRPTRDICSVQIISFSVQSCFSLQISSWSVRDWVPASKDMRTWYITTIPHGYS